MDNVEIAELCNDSCAVFCDLIKDRRVKFWVDTTTWQRVNAVQLVTDIRLGADLFKNGVIGPWAEHRMRLADLTTDEQRMLFIFYSILSD